MIPSFYQHTNVFMKTSFYSCLSFGNILFLYLTQQLILFQWIVVSIDTVSSISLYFAKLSNYQKCFLETNFLYLYCEYNYSQTTKHIEKRFKDISLMIRYFVALDKLSTLCPNSLQFHYILLQFSIKFEQECNNNFIIALLLGLQCNNNLLLHSCSNLYKINV